MSRQRNGGGLSRSRYPVNTYLRYHCGHTVTQIMVQMGLTTEKGRVTEKGRLFCYEALDAGRSG